MLTDKTLKQAEEFAKIVHKGQFRRDGVTPYIDHPLEVSRRCSNLEEKIVAVLHDVLEDAEDREWAEQRLKSLFSDSIVEAVFAITKEKDEKNYEYWQRVKKNSLACKVKVQDMLCNLGDDPTLYQTNKYLRGLNFLLLNKLG